MIYLDNNATTPIDARVLEAMLPFLQNFYGNPSSLYKMGRLTRSAIDNAREQVANLIGAKAKQVIFTSGGTEANALGLQTITTKTQYLISAIEHPSLSENARNLHPNVAIIPVNSQGLISIDNVNIPTQTPTLISIMLANNETGVIQPIAELGKQLSNQNNIIFHTDAVQALGKIPVSFPNLHVNRMSISSHKINGPKGCGALIVDDVSNMQALIVGGGQEQDQRSGTENVAAIVGFGKAAELAQLELDAKIKHLLKLRTELEQALLTIFNLVIFAVESKRLPNTVQFGIPNYDGEMLLMQLDQHNIAVSSASACASGGGTPSHVLTAMGISTQLAKSAIRISLGQQNTSADIHQFITILKTLL